MLVGMAVQADEGRQVTGAEETRPGRGCRGGGGQGQARLRVEESGWLQRLGSGPEATGRARGQFRSLLCMRRFGTKDQRELTQWSSARDTE